MNRFIKPGILLGLGIGCMIMSTIEGILYAPDARDAVEEKKEELGVDKLPAGELIKTVAPYYGPSAVLTAVGTGCILASNNKVVDIASGEALMALAADRTAREYREKTKEIVGAKKEQQIRESLAADAVARNPKGNREVIITGKGNHLCMEKLTGKYFRSNVDELKGIKNILNDKLNNSDFVSVNEYCYALGIGPTKLGDERGWMRGQGLLEFKFTAVLCDDGEPCLVLDVEQKPQDL